MLTSSSQSFCFQYCPGMQIWRDFHVPRANAVYYHNRSHIISEVLFAVILPRIILPKKECPGCVCQKLYNGFRLNRGGLEQWHALMNTIMKLQAS